MKYTNTNTTKKSIPSASEVKLFSYTGSKYKFEKQFANTHSKHQVKKVKYYIEAFAGSLASMFHNLQHIQADTIIINDFNPKLINLYKQVKTEPELLKKGIQVLEDEFQKLIPTQLQGQRLIKKTDRDNFKNNQKFYLDARELLNKSTGIRQAILMLFILNHNFRGNYSENKKRGVNISFNWSSLKLDIENLHEAIDNLSAFFNSHTIIFQNLDVFALLQKYNDPDTCIYLDPPYIDTEVQYTKVSPNNFKDINIHKKMISACSKYDLTVYSNNYDKTFVNLFDNHTTFERPSTISTQSTDKSKKEILAFKLRMQDVCVAAILDQVLSAPFNNPEFSVKQTLESVLPDDDFKQAV